MIVEVIAAIALGGSAQQSSLGADIADLQRRARALASGEYEARVRAEEAHAPIVFVTPADYRNAAHRAVLELLRDPASATFRNVMWTRTANGGGHFCGEVNARNAFGGMSGFTRFQAFASPSGATHAEIDDEDGPVGAYFAETWRRDCREGQRTQF